MTISVQWNTHYCLVTLEKQASEVPNDKRKVVKHKHIPVLDLEGTICM